MCSCYLLQVIKDEYRLYNEMVEKIFAMFFQAFFWLFFASKWPTVVVCTYIVCLWKQKLCMMITLPDRVVSSWYLGPSLMSKISCKYCHFIFFSVLMIPCFLLAFKLFHCWLPSLSYWQESFFCMFFKDFLEKKRCKYIEEGSMYLHFFCKLDSDMRYHNH